MNTAPIVLFVYNRPIHTQKVLNALLQCNLSEETELFIFSDGPKQDANFNEIKSIEDVRFIIRGISGFKKTILVEREKNYGLGKSIIEGLDVIFQKYESAIILEDDLVVVPTFLEYMNYYLDCYKDKKEVWHISGFQKNCWLQVFVEPVFFTHFMNCWGWGTWSDRWSRLNTDVKIINNYISCKQNKTLFDYEKLEHSEQLKLNEYEIKTWAIFWYATILMNRGLCVNPRLSLVQNIGDDGSGTNMGITTKNRIDFVGHFNINRPFLSSRIYETFLNRNFIIQAYAKNSKLSLVNFKRLIFKMSTKILAK